MSYNTALKGSIVKASSFSCRSGHGNRIPRTKNYEMIIFFLYSSYRNARNDLKKPVGFNPLRESPLPSLKCLHVHIENLRAGEGEGKGADREGTLRSSGEVRER